MTEATATPPDVQGPQDDRDGSCAVIGARPQGAPVDHRLTQAGDALEHPDRVAPIGLTQLDDDGVAVEFGFEVLWCPAGDDPAPVDDGDLAGESVGLLEVVGGEQDRQAFAGEALDLRPQIGSRLGIEAGGGLVQEQHAWPGG